MTAHWMSRGEHELPADTGWLGPWEADRLARMRYAKRRNDYLVGRWTAKHALAGFLGEDPVPARLARLEVRNLPSGAPEAYVDDRPAGAAIALTDRAGWAVCLLSRQAGAVGCDLELLEPRSDAFVSDYLTPAEQRVVRAAADPVDRDRLANLMWSAKESALKVLRTGLRRDTRSVEVTFGGIAADGTVEGTADGAAGTVGAGDPGGAWRPLTVRAEEGTVFPGWWRQFGAFLLTVAATDPLPPPEALHDPSQLARAAPTHLWMRAPTVG